MIIRLVLGGAYGAVMGAVAGWLLFATVPAAIGLGAAMVACICGALIAAASEDDPF